MFVYFFCIFLTKRSLLLLLGSYHSFPYGAHPYMKCSLISPIFLKSSLVFTILLFSSLSLHCSCKKAFSLLAILWNSAFSWVYLSLSLLLFTSLLFVRPPQATILPSCISFSLGWFWSPPPVKCCESPSIVFQVLVSRI